MTLRKLELRLVRIRSSGKRTRHFSKTYIRTIILYFRIRGTSQRYTMTAPICHRLVFPMLREQSWEETRKWSTGSETGPSSRGNSRPGEDFDMVHGKAPMVWTQYPTSSLSLTWKLEKIEELFSNDIISGHVRLAYSIRTLVDLPPVLATLGHPWQLRLHFQLLDEENLFRLPTDRDENMDVPSRLIGERKTVHTVHLPK